MQDNRTRGVSIARDLPVSATKPRRGPCHTICHLLPALVGNGIKCLCCRCRAPPRREQINENQTKLPRLGLQQLRFHLLVEPVPCHTVYHFVSAFSLSSLLAPSAAWCSQLLSASSPCHLDLKHSAASTSPRPLPTLLGRRGP